MEVTNALEQGDSEEGYDAEALSRSDIAEELIAIGDDLDDRWRGALFSLNPRNPDAARHFCASAREIFVRILDLRAPDAVVLEQNPACERAESGSPTRREKIRYLLVEAGLSDQDALEFVDEDVSNVLELFRVLNDGTHGSSGRFGQTALMAIKRRVEDGILYLSSISKYQAVLGHQSTRIE